MGLHWCHQCAHPITLGRQCTVTQGRLEQHETSLRDVRSSLSQVLIVHGENDALVPFRNSRKLAQIIPNAQFAGLSACGHNPQVWLG